MFENKIDINWQDYAEIFIRRKWFFIAPFALVFAGTIIATFFMPRIYEAKATIIVEESKKINPLLNNLAISTTVQSRLHLLKEEILSWPRMLQLVEEMRMTKDKENPVDLEKLILKTRKNVSVDMKDKNTDIIFISYEDKDPKVAQNMVNTLTDIFIRRNLKSQDEESSTAIDFINDQLLVYKKKLEASEKALSDFKETYGIEMPLAERINTELARLQAELTGALVDCTEDHPRVKTLREKIESLQQKRNDEIKQAAGLANVDPKEYVAIAESAPRQEQVLASLTRDYQINEKIYASLLDRLETANISQELENSENKTKFKVVEPARLPLKPIKPNKLKFTFIGLLLGICAGAGCIYLAEYIDSSFKGTEELKSAYEIPVLGAISMITTEEELCAQKAPLKTALIWCHDVLGIEYVRKFL